VLRSLKISNYRGFRNHTVTFRELTVAVGRNNAGKSTLVEALRLVALAAARHQTSTYRQSPRRIDAPPGIQPALEDLQLEATGLFYRYGDPPARITANFSSGHSLELYLASEELLHSVLRLPNGRAAKSSREAREAGLPRVSILPQVAPVSSEELRLTPEYVRRMAYTRLAPQHLRNQLAVFSERFPAFRTLVEESWPGLRINELEVPRIMDTSGQLRLIVRNQDFVAEVATMGHGVQMWLQVIWFLAREGSAECVILDEPDVYMHPDLQRRLIRLLRKRPGQVILTTHSPEIMAEVDPEQILVVDRGRPRSSFATSLPAAQAVLTSLGSVQNLQLTRLWKAKKFLLVEGKDVRILKQFQNTLFPDSLEPFDTIPGMGIGGWSGWPWAVGSAMAMRNAAGEEIKVFCILDSDFHPPEVVLERQRQAEGVGIALHIWTKKELENFLLVPAALARVIRAGAAVESDVSIGEIDRKLREVTETLRDGALDALATEFSCLDRSLGVAGANRKAREFRASRLASGAAESDLVSGKEILSRLSAWAQERWGASFGPLRVARSIRPGDLAPELKHVVETIERGDRFVPPGQP